ncbi:nuclear transport factor 2 family protein [Rhodococcus erythropolis]|uniref:nuclear transport factor 2 family protein n=1 Tax=Rhodococcus erythropolis TaxID=1833 RepID=UPI0037916E45
MDSQIRAIGLLEELSAERDVQRLHARYAQLCDAGYPAELIAELFVPEGIWEASPDVGSFKGQEQIRQHFENAAANYPWALHANIPLQIEVSHDGLTAHGVWYLLMPCIDTTTGVATGAWLAGRYDNDFVKVDGNWYYRHLRVHFGLMSPNHLDWARDRYTLLSKDMPHQEKDSPSDLPSHSGHQEKR